MSQADDETIEPMSDEESLLLSSYNAPYQPDGAHSADIPYSGSIGAVSIVGVLRVREPVERSSTEGVFAGIVNGTYRIGFQSAEAKAYGPFTRAVVEVDWTRRRVRWRVDSQQFPSGGWSRGGWQRLATW